MTIYTERAVVSRAQGEGRMTIAAVCDVKHAMKVRALEPAVLRAHPADVADFTAEVHGSQRWIEPITLGVQRWAGLLVKPDANVPFGMWVVETKTESSQWAIE